jgi:DNA polymerase I-like protein with 3'-5' exonuclease and polymerase domains
MALRYPHLRPLRELHATLDQLKLNALQVGPDGRNRCWLGPFRATTSRNQPSSAKFLFGPATWVRGFAKPGPGQVLAYCDWSAQEIAIAAALSGDAQMQGDYLSGDPYIGFGRAIGYVPMDATKKSHSTERDVLKRVLLATGYGMGVIKMASELDKLEFEVGQILRQHRLRYDTFWEWVEEEIASSFIRGFMRTRLGWQIKVLEGCRPTSLLNWHMQSNGAEMMRLAIILAVEQGLKICAPVHDALLLEAPVDDLRDHVHALEACMTRASEIVLDGFQIRIGVEEVVYPNRYSDPRGLETWNTVMDIVSQLNPIG